VPTLLLVRHGRTTANASGVLAGWTPGVGLDDTGRTQAHDLGRRLAELPIQRWVSSPLQRCQETIAALIEEHTVAPAPKPRAGRAAKTPAPQPEVLTEDRLGEQRYGDWTGRPLRELVKEPLWRVVQSHPSAVTFPGPEGESMPAMQARAVAAVHDHDAAVLAEHGPDALWVALSHGDVIKAVLADALGMHLDSFQRIVVEPASLSVISYTPLRPFVVRMNDISGEVASLRPPKRRRRKAGSDAVVGGQTGNGQR